MTSRADTTRLVDTNVLVYRHDSRFPDKQEIATRLLRDGVVQGHVVLAHQCVVEFVSATIRPREDLGGEPLLSEVDAYREAEGLMLDFRVLYPDRLVLTTALRGAAVYGMSWYDAHLWAYAEANGIPEILSEDYQHGRHYGKVRVVDPFLSAAGSVHELPPMYEVAPA